MANLRYLPAKINIFKSDQITADTIRRAETLKAAGWKPNQNLESALKAHSGE